MEKMPVKQNHMYTVTCDGECNIYDHDTQALVHTHKEGEVQSQFTAIGMSVDYDNADAKLTLVFNTAPGGSSNGGNIESDLNVGHAAADAVAAVCTLTLGDLAKGGTLTDSNGQSVELANPHKYADGWVGMPDATAAGTIAFGEHEAIEFEAKAAANASCYWENETGSYGLPPIQLRRLADPENPAGEYEVLWESLEGYGTDEEFVAAFNSEQEFAEAEISELEYNPFLITAKGDYAGAEGNRLVIANNSEMYARQLSGGQEARTPQEVVDALNVSEDCPAIAQLDADEGGIGFTAKEYGVNDTIVVTGSLFSYAIGMRNGHGDYTVAELVTAIEGEFSDITPAAGEAAGTITLTATTAGKAANAITYTATGCFGSGITRQGSTTRGKDAVQQTDYKIYLNGEEFSGGGAPAAPVPEPLGTTTTLLHGHVYTLAVAGDTDLSALVVELYGTCELWLDYTAGSVTWPTGLWWAEGSAPTLAAGKSYAIALRNDGVKRRANVQYEDTTPAQS